MTALDLTDGALDGEPLHLSQAFGHTVSLDFHRLSLDHVAELVSQAGLVVADARLLREPDETEKVQQTHLLDRTVTVVQVDHQGDV